MSLRVLTAAVASGERRRSAKLRGEIQLDPTEACGNMRDREGGAGFPRGLLPTYGVSGVHRVAWALELDPARRRVHAVRRCPARGGRSGAGSTRQRKRRQRVGCGSGERCGGAYRFTRKVGRSGVVWRCWAGWLAGPLASGLAGSLLLLFFNRSSSSKT